MARCNMDALLDKISEKKLTKQEEVSFTLHVDLPDCRKIDTKNYETAAEGASYNRWTKPLNRFECLRNGCTNTGTLTMASANDAVLYHANFDANEYAAGVLTFYVKPATTPATVTVTISSDKALTNADVYTVNIASGDIQDDGFAPVFIDLAQAPASETGTGWSASVAGAYIQLSASVVTGYSSLSLFESIYDFEINDTVKVGCLSEIGGSFDVDALEATCTEAGYDDSLSNLEYTVTGNLVTPNYWKLNPLLAKGDTTVGYFPNTVEKTVESYQNGAYGHITITDAYQDECGYWAAQIADDCNFSDAFLTQLSIPIMTTIDEGHYQVIKNDDGTTDVIVNAALIGKNIRVSYPQEVTIESELVADVENLNAVHTRMTVPRETSDGVRYLLIFDNVLITSFPATINTEETEFSFTINIQRNKDGIFFRRQQIAG